MFIQEHVYQRPERTQAAKDRDLVVAHNLRAKRTLSHAIFYLGSDDGAVILRSALGQIYLEHRDLVRATISHRCGKCKKYRGARG
jgi:hypothetical protein